MNYDQKVIYNVHIKDNPTLVSAMGEMAPIRKLGSKTMQTGSLDLTDGMREAGTLGTAAKLRLVQHGSCKPYFDLAA